MKKYKILILLLLIHLTVLIFLRFTAWPEMILWPYFIIRGLLPYRDIAMAHNPLLIFDLAIFYKIFGVSLFSLKLYSWILILLTDVLVYWVAEKLTRDKKIALLSCAFYILWQPYFEGNGVWFDHVLAPVGLLIFYLAWQKDFSWAGVFAGLAILVKQTAFWFFAPLALTFWYLKCLKRKPVSKFFSGFIIPILVFSFYLTIKNLWPDFYFWAIRFGVGFLPRTPGQIEFPKVKEALSLGIPYAFTIPAVFLLLSKKTESKTERGFLILALFWCFFGAAGVYPRFDYFHFQPSLPFLAMISGVVLSKLGLFLKKNFRPYFLAYLVLVILGTVHLQARFYRLHWQKPDRFFEKETFEAASWLQENTEPNEKIFILNSWDHLYALTNTLPAISPWVPTLPWYMEYDKIQEGIVEDLESKRPSLIVFEPYRREGLGSYKPEEINRFLIENYQLSEIIAGRFWIFRLRTK